MYSNPFSINIYHVLASSWSNSQYSMADCIFCAFPIIVPDQERIKRGGGGGGGGAKTEY